MFYNDKLDFMWIPAEKRFACSLFVCAFARILSTTHSGLLHIYNDLTGFISLSALQVRRLFLNARQSFLEVFAKTALIACGLLELRNGFRWWE